MPKTQRREWSVPITTSTGETGATLVWRRHGRVYLTAVVKATFAIVPGGVMTQIEPESIARDEQEHAAGLRMAGDLVPFRSQADVLITGHVPVPLRGPGAGVPVRFTVSRDGAALLDKSLSLQVPAGAPAGPVRLFGLGPLSRHWPIRSRLLGTHDPGLFEGVGIDLPPAFDESYFQAAPIDQRLDGLRGDERIAFEGARRDGVRIETQLPGVRAVARLHGPSVERGGMRPLNLVIDMLHIDLDQGVCNVTWRGVTPVVREDDLAATHLVAAVELSARSLAPTAGSMTTASSRPPPALLTATLCLDPEDIPRDFALTARSAPPPGIPLAAGPLDRPTRVPSSELPPKGLPSDEGLLPPLQAVLAPPPRRSLPPPLPPRRPPSASDPALASSRLSGDWVSPSAPPLLDLPPGRGAPLTPVERPAAPTAGGSPLLVDYPKPHSLGKTMDLTAAEVAQLRAVPAMPFALDAPAPFAPARLSVALAPEPFAWQERNASPWARETSPSSSMLARTAPAEEEESTLELAPSPAVAAAPMQLGPRAAVSTEGKTFGAHFLAAMALRDGMGDQA